MSRFIMKKQQKKRGSIWSPSRFWRAQRFDGARDVPADRGMWAHADLLAIDACNNATTRARIRSRARYVVANNAYANGAAQAVTNATVGTTPRLQLTSGELDATTLAMVEDDFAEWSTAVRLPEKLRAMRFARFVDGEAFAVLYSNRRLTTSGGVMLDVKTIDADRVTSAVTDAATNDNVDGIKLDKYGNAIAFRILDDHPGATAAALNFGAATEYPATNVCHWFRQNYPEQHRGISELAPALELFALIDRYSKAVVQASETAADLSMVFTTDAVDDPGAYNIDDEPAPSAGDSPFATIPWSRGMTITAPDGWHAQQVKSEQPTSSYSMLVNEILSQIGAAISVPKLLMKNSAENYNYSSARVDLQQFQIATRLDRQTMIASVLNPIFRAWLDEYRVVTGIDGDVRATWYFDGFFHVDPLKEANAQTVRFANRTTTFASEYGARGLDWEQELRELAREKAYIKQLEEEFGVKLSNDCDQTQIDDSDGGN